MEEFFDFFVFLLRESFASLTSSGASLLWLLPQSYRLLRFLTILFRAGFCPRGLVWLQAHTLVTLGILISCRDFFQTASQGLWMDCFPLCLLCPGETVLSQLPALHMGLSFSSQISGFHLCSSWGLSLNLCPHGDIKTPILGIPAFPCAALSML